MAEFGWSAGKSGQSGQVVIDLDVECDREGVYVCRHKQIMDALAFVVPTTFGLTRLVIDIAEWVNKSSGRGSISLGVDNEDGQGPEKLASWGVFLGLSDYAEVVPRLFAWADVHLHEETYDEAAYNLFETECSVWDEGDRFLTEDFGLLRTFRTGDLLGSFSRR